MAVSRSDLYTSINKKQEIYSDFLSDLVPHPDTGEVMRSVNETAVARSIRNLILTNNYERIMHPEIGGNIHSLLFEPVGHDTIESIRRAILDTIDKHEKRARILSCDVVESSDNLAYFVTIIFYVINKEDPITTNITLNRVR